MSSPALYRFVPWTRRGLVAELRDTAAAEAGPLPQRGRIKLDVTLSGGNGSAATATEIAGPGDVIGIDPGAIVRTTPRRDASSVEPNYLVAVDFDEADFPWLMTPAAGSPQGKLRPWLALVVVEDRPGVKITVPAGAPLPQLRIGSGASRELHDLAGSSAWAHTQLLVEEGSGAEAAPAQLASDPDRHVSRLLCPRRLRADTRWLACLVPAFDAGVRRGLGLAPQGDSLGPAWTDEDAITLPLYYHWSFGTGPEGDFESLARRLRPFAIESVDGTPTVGTVKMHIGEPGGEVHLDDHPQRIIEMDGALRAVQQEDGTLAEVPAALRDPLASLLNSIADPSGTDPDDGAVGPPLYGAWPANRFAVAGSDAGWFAELNLDPRARVAAGLGAEMVRAEQEDLMTACWQQVGAVLETNGLLSRARLSIEASIRFHARTVSRLAPERLLMFAAPLAGRTPLAARTVRAAITPTSLPDELVDPAARRLTAPTGRFVRRAARRAAIEPVAVSRQLVSGLAAGKAAVDPTAFVPAGIAPPAGRDPVAVAGGLVDLFPIGLPVKLSAESFAGLEKGIAAVRSAPPPADERLGLRADLRSTGLLTSRHVTALSAFAAAAAGEGPLHSDGILELRSAAAAQPSPAAFMLGREPAGRVGIRALDLTGHGEIVLRTPPAEPSEVLATFEGPIASRAALARLPLGALRPGERPAVVRLGAVAGDLVVERPRPRPGERGAQGLTATVPPPFREAAVLTRFESAISLLGEVSALPAPRPAATVVAFPLAGASAALRDRCAPANAHVARLGTMVRFGSTPLSELVAGAAIDGLAVSPLVDRVMAYPELPEPAYRMLARHERDRLLPGVDAIPPDSITLLETNPRFVAAYLAGVNHELNRELLWRRYPTDQRGTPMQRFWGRAGGAADIPPMHRWEPTTRTLVELAGGESNLVLLVRGELLRRYPNLAVLAIAASGPDTPSSSDADVRRPIFRGFLDPDITFFGFDLEDDDLTAGHGWFFALQEEVTEPRFALDETVDPDRAGPPAAWRAVAWPDSGIVPGDPFTIAGLRALAADRGLEPVPATGAEAADALFQSPIQVLVHARSLVQGEQR